jgi:hypothetical protein
MKYSNFEGILAWSGGTMTLRKDQTIDDDHPLVTERPELWSAEPSTASLSTPTIERATRAPGEVRNTPGTGPANRVIKGR